MQTLTAKRTANLSDSALREAEATVREVEIRLDAARQTLVNLGLPLGESELKQTTPEILKARLQRLGLPDDLVKTLNVQSTTANLLPIVAPMDGVIVSRDIVAGEVVDLAKILFEVVDNRAMWLTCDVRGEDVSKLRVGQPLRFKLDSSTDEITGTLAWISTQIDPKTRTVKVRANIPNREGLLRANSFGSARVILREEADVVSIPNEALQSDGCCTLVFVRDKSFLSPESPKVFHIRKVRTGAKSETHTEIIAGLLPGERIVTKGSGALLAELMKGELGDGCGCH